MHSHDHNHSNHNAYEYSQSRRAFLIATGLTFGFATIEAIGGWYTHSLVLLSDAGHMVSDSLALVLAAFASWIASKPPSIHHTYGLGRVEVIVAWISSLIMVGVAASVVIAAIERFSTTAPVQGEIVIVIALLGLLVNTIIARILSQTHQTLNTQAAMLHVLGDLLGSIAALFSGIVIFFSDWHLIDPILSLFIAALILMSSVRLLRETLQVLMEGVPTHIKLNEVGMAMATVNHVLSVHDLHIWTLSSGMVVLSAHIELNSLKNWQSAFGGLSQLLKDKFDITHVTLQPEIHYKELKYQPQFTVYRGTHE